MKKIKWLGIIGLLLFIIVIVASIFGSSKEEDLFTLYQVGKNSEFFEAKDFKPVDNKERAFEQGDILKYNNVIIMIQDSILVPKDMLVDQYPETANLKEDFPILDVKFEFLNFGQENLSLVPESFGLIHNGELYSGALIHPETSIEAIKKDETRLVRTAFKAPMYEDPTKPYEVIVYLENPEKKLLPIKFNIKP